MYRFEKTKLAKGRSVKYFLYRKEEQLLYIDFLNFLQRDKGFRSFFIELLSGIPFHAFQWETPPVTLSSIDQPFEFVVTDSPGIDLPPDPGPFRHYLNELDQGETVAVFNNLGRDAQLIAPAPSPEDAGLNYSHIGVFTQNAPVGEQHALWQKTGRLTEELLSDRPLWLNTAGGGVAWLHIRLDSSPKYYRHRPYRDASSR